MRRISKALAGTVVCFILLMVFRYFEIGVPGLEETFMSLLLATLTGAGVYVAPKNSD